MKEVKQWFGSELENTELCRKFDILEKTAKEEYSKESKKQGLKLNVISRKTFDMTREEAIIMSIISVAGHHVVKTCVKRPKSPRYTWTSRALLTTDGPRLIKVDGHYIKVYGPYPILMNMDGINIYRKAHVTDAIDKVGRINISREELKVRCIQKNAMLEQEAVHIGCEINLDSHLLDVQDRHLSGK